MNITVQRAGSQLASISSTVGTSAAGSSRRTGTRSSSSTK
jgi:hypothetical protein